MNRKTIITQFVANVGTILLGSIPTAIFGVEYGLLCGFLAGAYGYPLILDFINRKNLIK